MGATRVVFRHEMAVRLRSWTFIISTGLALIILGLMIAMSYYGQRTPATVRIATTSEVDPVITLAQQIAKGSGSTKLVISQSEGTELESAVERRAVDCALYVDGGQYVLLDSGSLDLTTTTTIQQAVQEYRVELNLAKAGVSREQIYQESDLRIVQVKASALDAQWRQLATTGLAIAFYMGTAIFGLSIAQSVSEERQSRTIEIVASAIPLRSLLTGKVLAGTLLALIQMGLYLATGGVALRIEGRLSLLTPIMGVLGWFVIYFIVGFLALATVWAAVGAATARQQDLQVKSTPLQFVLMGSLVASLTLQGVPLKVLSYVPIASSIAMPRRILEQEAQTGEVLMSLSVAIAFAIGALFLGGRSFSRSLRSAY